MSITEILRKNLGIEHIYDGLIGREKGVVPGWTAGEYRDFLRGLFRTFPADKDLVFVEVGTWMGSSAIIAADVLKELKMKGCVICVDTWLGSPEHYFNIPRDRGYPAVYKEFLQNVFDYDHTDVIIPITLPSMQAIKVLQKLGVVADIVFIDAAHEYTPVFLDCIEYFNILRPGGEMMGDDYNEAWPEVIKAVDDFVKHAKTSIEIVGNRVWHFRRPESHTSFIRFGSSR